jgi:2-dehydro-3-deoxy-D-pentonate aldolase
MTRYQPREVNRSMNPLRIRGIVPPVPTPLTLAGKIDEAALYRIMDHLVHGGCDAAYVLGSTGELASLSRGQRETVIRVSVAAAAGRIPVLVGIGDTCREETLSLASFASDHGGDGLVLNAPCYYDLTSDELIRYFDSILRQLERPTLLYNMPWLTGHILGMDCLQAALEHPNVIGFKDSSGDMDYLKGMIAVAAGREDVTVLVGNEYFFLEALKLGAHGVVGGGANIYPGLFRALQDAYQQGDLTTCEALQGQIAQLGHQILNITGRPTSVFCGVKGGVAALGLCEPHMFAPLTACTDAQIECIRETLLSAFPDSPVGAICEVA